jgi:hypothetical protein
MSVLLLKNRTDTPGIVLTTSPWHSASDRGARLTKCGVTINSMVGKWRFKNWASNSRVDTVCVQPTNCFSKALSSALNWSRSA